MRQGNGTKGKAPNKERGISFCYLFTDGWPTSSKLDVNVAQEASLFELCSNPFCRVLTIGVLVTNSYAIVGYNSGDWIVPSPGKEKIIKEGAR